MADWGIKIMNDSNTVQIGQDYMNLEMKRKITTDIKDWEVVNQGTVKTQNVTIKRFHCDLAEDEIFVGFCIDGVEGCSIAPMIGHSIKGIDFLAGVSDKPLGKGKIEFYVFGYGTGESSNNKYGLIVKNKNGKIVFDSNKKYMKLIKCVNKELKHGFWKDQLFYSGEKKVAICFSVVPQYFIKDDATDDYDTDNTFMGVTKNSKGDIVSNYVTVWNYYDLLGGDSEQSIDVLQYMLIDVTGY